MNAIEFITNISSDGIIQLPEKYKTYFQNQVKVIILSEEEADDYKEKVARQYEKVKAILKEIQD